jgi:hypothetical protein
MRQLSNAPASTNPRRAAIVGVYRKAGFRSLGDAWADTTTRLPSKGRQGFAQDPSLEGAGFEPSVPRQESRRFEPASVPSRGGRCRRGGYGPGGDRRPDRAVEIADRRWCASEPPLESGIKPSRRVGPSRGTDGSNPSPSSGQSESRKAAAVAGEEPHVSRGYARLGWRCGRQRRAGARRIRLNRC